MKHSWTALITALASAVLAACGPSETSRSENAATNAEVAANAAVATNQAAPGAAGPVEGNAVRPTPVAPSGSQPQPSGAPPPAVPSPPPQVPRQPEPALEHEYMNHADHGDHADPSPGKDDPLR